MNRFHSLRVLGLLLSFAATTVGADVLDPNCTAEKAAKSAAMKTTVGVGGRCDPKEALTDTAKDAANVEDKGPIEKARDDHENKDKKKEEKDK
jgi:hypothetical protein